jgi:hypothetical protein
MLTFRQFSEEMAMVMAYGLAMVVGHFRKMSSSLSKAFP